MATSILKVTGAELTKDRAALGQYVRGVAGSGVESVTPAEKTANETFLQTNAVSIYAGTSEIQMNIIAKRVPGPPDQSLRQG